MSEAKPHYVKNKDLMPEIVAYRETGLCSEKLGGMFLLIARNLSNKGNFINYTWKDDMIQEAVLTCVKYSKNFNPEKSNNPFAYVTTICKNAFVNYINKQNRHSTIKDKCYNMKESMHSTGDYLSEKAIDYTQFSNDDYVQAGAGVRQENEKGEVNETYDGYDEYDD